MKKLERLAKKKGKKIEPKSKEHMDLVRSFKQADASERMVATQKANRLAKGKISIDEVIQNFMYQDIAVFDADGNEIVLTAIQHIVAMIIKKAIFDEDLEAARMALKELRGGAALIQLTNTTNQPLSDEAAAMLKEAGITFIDGECSEVDEETYDTDLFD